MSVFAAYVDGMGRRRASGLNAGNEPPEVAVISDVYPITMRSTGISSRTMVTEE
jgi:hypothetical protein